MFGRSRVGVDIITFSSSANDVDITLYTYINYVRASIENPC